MVDEAARHADDPGSLVRALAQILAGRFERSGYQSGCAIATMVLELGPRLRGFQRRFRQSLCAVAGGAGHPLRTAGHRPRPRRGARRPDHLDPRGRARPTAAPPAASSRSRPPSRRSSAQSTATVPPSLRGLTSNIGEGNRDQTSSNSGSSALGHEADRRSTFYLEGLGSYRAHAGGTRPRSHSGRHRVLRPCPSVARGLRPARAQPRRVLAGSSLPDRHSGEALPLTSRD